MTARKIDNSDLHITWSAINNGVRPPWLKIPRTATDVQYCVGRLTSVETRKGKPQYYGTARHRNWAKGRWRKGDEAKTFYDEDTYELELYGNMFGPQKYKPQATDGMLSLAVPSDVVRIWTWTHAGTAHCRAQSIRHIPRQSERKALSNLADSIKKDIKAMEAHTVERERMGRDAWGEREWPTRNSPMVEDSGRQLALMQELEIPFVNDHQQPGIVFWYPSIALRLWDVFYGKPDRFEKWAAVMRQGPAVVHNTVSEHQLTRGSR